MFGKLTGFLTEPDHIAGSPPVQTSPAGPSTPSTTEVQVFEPFSAQGLNSDGQVLSSSNGSAGGTVEGFLSPEAVSISGDRPYAAQIPISGTTDCMSDVDYYEFQWSDDDGVTWNDMPIGAAGAVVRGYIEFPSLTFGYPLFSAVPTGCTHAATPPARNAGAPAYQAPGRPD